MKLFELSAVIKNDGLTLLQTALNFESPRNMDLKGAMACLLQAVSEVIKQQTGQQISRLSFAQALSADDNELSNTAFYTPKKYHSFKELIQKLSTTGVPLYGGNRETAPGSKPPSKKNYKFNIKLHPLHSAADMRHALDQGFSIITAYQNNDTVSEADNIMRLYYSRWIDAIGVENLSDKAKFKEKLKALYKSPGPRPNLPGMSYLGEDPEFLRAALRGIIPLVDKLEFDNSYHAVNIVGYDTGEKVFIGREGRAHYALKGFLKIPYEYFERFFKNAKSTFIVSIAAIEAETGKPV